MAAPSSVPVDTALLGQVVYAPEETVGNVAKRPPARLMTAGSPQAQARNFSDRMVIIADDIRFRMTTPSPLILNPNLM